jgi:hypothetical protein
VSEGIIDVGNFPRDGNGDFLLPSFDPDSDCDYRAGSYPVWSVGKHRRCGFFVASITTRFYMHPDFQCVWLR